MKKSCLFFIFVIFFNINKILFAQTTANDIPVSKLPSEVKNVLDEYINILSNSTDLDDCANKFVSIAGGTLVNENGDGLRNTVQGFGLKKDFNNMRHYANPVRITRVNLSNINKAGYGESAIGGKMYKIWIDKKDKKLGMPAPVSILVPESHSTIKKPKVINIGSF